jgi:integrase
MATITFHFRPSKRPGVSEGRLFIRVIHDRRVKDIITGYRILPREWDNEQHCLIIPESYSPRLKYILDTEDRMQIDLQRLSVIVNVFSNQETYSVEDICRTFTGRQKDNSLSSFVEKLVKKLASNGQERTSRAYRTSVNSLLLFNKGVDIRLEEINKPLISKYERYLKENGKNMNTISFYLRNLRTIYNKAVKEHRVPARIENPFSDAYTGVFSTPKRALTKDEMRALAELEIMLAPREKNNKRRLIYLDEESKYSMYHSLAMFMFCFHARGMSFVDMAFLKKTNIHGDEICYCRKKTGKILRVRITRPMRAILIYFSKMTERSPYVFPLIKPGAGTERTQYENALVDQNKKLKIIARMAKITKSISTHFARHSWATIARTEKIPLAIISEALGHRDEKTTTIYLDSFNTSVIDRVSEKVSNSIH